MNWEKMETPEFNQSPRASLSAPPDMPSMWEAIVVVTASIFLINGLFYLMANGQSQRHYFVLFEALILPPAVGIALFRRYDVVRLFHWHGVRPVIFLWCLLLTAAMSVLFDGYERGIEMLFPDRVLEYQELLKGTIASDTPYDFIMLLLGIVIIAAVSEELLFRGFLLQTLQTYRPGFKPVVAVALIFTLLHFIWFRYPWLFVEYMVIGIVLGVAAWKTSSIFPPMAIHIFHNGMAFFFGNMDEGPPSRDETGVWTWLFILLCAAGVFRLAYGQLIRYDRNGGKGMD